MQAVNAWPHVLWENPPDIIQWTSDWSTWPTAAGQLSLLFWRQSYIFNDLQKSPCENGGKVEITAKQFAFRIKLSSLLPSTNMQK